MTRTEDTNIAAENIQEEIKQKTSELKASNAFLKATTTTMVPPNELVVDINQLQQREKELQILQEQQQQQQLLLQQQLIIQQQQQLQQLQQLQVEQQQQDIQTSFIPSSLKQSVSDFPKQSLQQSVLLPQVGGGIVVGGILPNQVTTNPLRQTLLNANTLGLTSIVPNPALSHTAVMAPATSPPLIVTSPSLAAQSSNANPATNNTVVLPTGNIVASALANVVAIPAEMSEITPLTPVTAIPIPSLAAIQNSPLGLTPPAPLLPNPSPRSPSNPLGGTLGGGYFNPLNSTFNPLSATISNNNTLKNIMEIPRYATDHTLPDETIASPGYVEMKEFSKTSVIVNIPSPVVAQQTILDGAEHIPLVSELLPISECAMTNSSGVCVTIADKSIALADTDCSVDKIKSKRKNRFSKEKMKKFKNSVYQILAPSTQLPIHLVDSETLETYVVPFLMELGRALLMSGVPAHRLEYELTLISSTFGIDGNFFTTPTGIFFSFGSPHTILSPYTHLLRIQSTDYNMERLVRLEELADEVIYGKKNCQTALVDLRDILKAPPLYSLYVTVISFIVSSFAFSFFLKCGWVEVGACSLVGLYVGLLYAAGCKWPTIGKVLEALSAFGGAIIASLINAFVSPVPRFMVTLGGIIALAPGLSLTISVAEISTRNLVSGNARLMGAFSCLLQLSFGIAMGTKFSDNILPVRKEIAPDSFPSWTMFLAVPLAAVSFAIQMKAHPRQMWIIMLTSILGIIGGNWGNEVFGTDVGSFFGACLICVAGNLYARFTNGASVVPIMSGIILLVPGSMGVKGLFSVSSGNVDGGIALFGGMFMIATSLTIGLLVANLLVKPHKAL